ncbi:MAG TPA: hypothetical protein VIV60_17155 [Polyangiaceae bacterium]
MTSVRASAPPSAHPGSDVAARRRSTPATESGRPSPSRDTSASPTQSRRIDTGGTSRQAATMPAFMRTPTPDEITTSRPPSAFPRGRGSDPSEADSREVRVKGINFTAGLEAIQRIYGAAARTCIEKETSGNVGNALRFGGIVAGGWYSAAWYREFWSSVKTNLGADEMAARNIGKYATEVSVNVAYRALARITSPSQLLAMSARAFGYYFERCSLSVSQPDSNRLTARWRDCNGFNGMVWHVVEGGCIYFIEATGAKDVTFSVISGGDDANHLMATATWR